MEGNKEYPLAYSNINYKLLKLTNLTNKQLFYNAL